MDETSYKSHNMIFICTDEGEWSVRVNIVNEIAYFCVYCCLKIGKTIPIYSENNITQSIRKVIKKRGKPSCSSEWEKTLLTKHYDNFIFFKKNEYFFNSSKGGVWIEWGVVIYLSNNKLLIMTFYYQAIILQSNYK